MGILQVKTVPDGKRHLDNPLATDGRERHRVRGRTLEWASIGALNGDIEVSQIIFMRCSGNPWCGVGNESFCLLLS